MSLQLLVVQPACPQRHGTERRRPSCRLASLSCPLCQSLFSIAMAGRAHKKLLQQQLGAELPPAASSSGEEESSEDEIEGSSAAPFNPFALLTDSEVRKSKEPDLLLLACFPGRLGNRIRSQSICRTTKKGQKAARRRKRSPAAQRQRRRRRRPRQQAAARRQPRRRRRLPSRARRVLQMTAMMTVRRQRRRGLPTRRSWMPSLQR